MNLNGINVLVDGYNLELNRRTGIGTYGVSLISALNRLNVNLYLLSSKKKYCSKNPLLDEVYFFDRQFSGNSKKNFLIIKEIIKDLFKFGFKKTKEITIHGKVVFDSPTENFISYLKGILSSTECYQVANMLYLFTRIKTKIKSPKRIDIWHATYPLPIKIRGAKKITTIHDLIPLKLPYATLDNKRFFYNNIEDSLKDSTTILTISESTKKDLLSIFDINPDKVHVTYESVVLTYNSIETKEETISGFLKKYHLTFRNYILFVGAIEPKKNVRRLINAYGALDVDIPLVIVGQKAWLWEQEIGHLEAIFGKNFHEKVKLLGHVDSADLKYLYTGAYCFVFPSLYEGFGLPPLEAMTCGCPVITSNVSSLPEVCGDAALYVDPYDVCDIRNKMEKLLNDPLLREKLSQAGKERAKLFSMENYVKRLYEAYRRIV